jgi:hypothetical protein
MTRMAIIVFHFLEEDTEAMVHVACYMLLLAFAFAFAFAFALRNSMI